MLRSFARFPNQFFKWFGFSGAWFFCDFAPDFLPWGESIFHIRGFQFRSGGRFFQFRLGSVFVAMVQIWLAMVAMVVMVAVVLIVAMVE